MKENHLCFLLKWLDLRVCRQNLSNLKRLENSILAVIVLFVAYWTVWCLLKMVECSHVATAVSLTPQQIRGVQPQHWSCAGENTTLWKYVAVLMLGLGFRINHFIRATMNTLSKLGVALYFFKLFDSFHLKGSSTPLQFADHRRVLGSAWNVELYTVGGTHPFCLPSCLNMEETLLLFPRMVLLVLAPFCEKICTFCGFCKYFPSKRFTKLCLCN